MSRVGFLIWFEVVPLTFFVSLLVEIFVALIVSAGKNLNSSKVIKGVFTAVFLSYFAIVLIVVKFPNVSPPVFYFVILLPEIIFEGAVIALVSDLDSLTATGISAVCNFCSFLANVAVLKFLGF